MTPLIVAIPLGLFIWMCSVAILSIGIAVGALAAYRLFKSFTLGWGHVMGGLIGAIIWGGFALIVVIGAFDLGASVMDAMIARLS